MQTKLLGVTLGLLFEGGAQPGSVARCGHLSPVRTQSCPPAFCYLSLVTANSMFLFQYSEKCLMMPMYLQTQEQSLLLLCKAINVHKLCLNGLVSFFCNCAE